MTPHASEHPAGAGRTRSPLNILILYDTHSLTANTIRDHLECFSLYSCHHIYYAHATFEAPVTLPLELFDVVIIHYSVRVSVPAHLSSHYAEALERYRGLKVLFNQDEYDNPLQACAWINRLGIQVVFSVVPPDYYRWVYRTVDHERVEFMPTLTGFVPPNLDRRRPPPPLAQRPVVIGYRGRQLSYVYGKLGHEKKMIGVRMRAVCEERGIRHDIEWTEDKRIYGDGWFDFLASCRATLGTESGSNVFDFDGTLAPTIRAAVQADPTLTFDEAFERYLKQHETKEIMNQISPRAFETIALRTGLILFEGRYSGVIRPDVHFISLRKDFSNVDEVLAKVQDDEYLGTMIERAYRDIIASGCYSYQSFVRGVDELLEARVPNPSSHRIAARVLGSVAPYANLEVFPETLVLSKPLHVQPLLTELQERQNLSAPINVQPLLAELQERRSAEEELKRVLGETRQRLAEAEDSARSLRDEMQQLRRSWSWRTGSALCAPLRYLRHGLKRRAVGRGQS